MYDMNTGNETWEWVNLKEVIKISVFSTWLSHHKIGSYHGMLSYSICL